MLGHVQVSNNMNSLTKAKNGNSAASSRSAWFLGVGVTGLATIVIYQVIYNRHYKNTYAPSITTVSHITSIAMESHIFSLSTGQVDNMSTTWQLATSTWTSM
jgi:hypothetical protein